MNRILIIDDEKNICESIRGILEDEGYTVDTAQAFRAGFSLLKQEMYDIVFLDIWLPDKDGTDGLVEIKKYFPEVEVVMISGHGNIENAVESVRRGAYDFLEKPLSMDRLVLITKHLVDKIKLQQDLREYKFNLLKKYDLIGVSRPIFELRKKIEKIGPTNAWVLITGENGTGKEHVARLIHMLSKRGNKSFVEINCSAIPSELIESEMFGHEKGAFTGAHTSTQGKFEIANEGTIFLDEVGDMEVSAQSKLLRVLETNEFTRVGGNEKIHSDFRLISATNKDLPEAIEGGDFREDLYYRINVVPLHVPPLRQRTDDIPHLVDHFIKEACSLNGLPLMRVDGALMEVFNNFSWPGNVRQLKNIIERMVVLAEDDVLTTEDAPSFLFGGVGAFESFDIEYTAPLKEAKERFEKVYILSVLKSHDWNVSAAARSLEMERSYLHRRIKHFDIDQYRESSGEQ